MSNFIKVKLIDCEDGRRFPSKEMLIRKDEIITLTTVEDYIHLEQKECYIYVGEEYGKQLAFIDYELFEEEGYKEVSIFKFSVAGTFEKLAEKIME